jgi:hypothetical protein
VRFQGERSKQTSGSKADAKENERDPKAALAID